MFRRVLRNETGQMAVFIALIFQVLFVLFAMVINIGLIVHDKINLQNSVDLAAYYAAAKQAESMNMIAHINYQMRQDYKLLSWRFRVLGSFGLDAPLKHPAVTDLQSGPLQDIDFVTTNSTEPTVCVGHPGWNESFDADPKGNKCRTNQVKIPDLVPPKFIKLAPSFNLFGIDFFKKARETIRQSCQNLSPYNWGLATHMMIGYRLSMTERKKQILKLSSNLSTEGDFTDISGESVRAGALKTLKKNLTASNGAPSSFDEQDESNFEFINGLSLGGCNQADALGFPYWLQDIKISPTLRYTELTVQPGDKSQCDATIKSYVQPPSSNTLSLLDPQGQLAALAGEPEGDDIRRSSRGFEKNPWCLAYVAIKAKTRPRKMFAPFGEPVTMEAKAIAEPFGGRIGPWYGKRWPSQASQSDGSDQTDPLAVPRGDFDPQYKPLYMPNYSRYPGDKLGLRSRLALGMMRDTFAAALTQNNVIFKFDIQDYFKLSESFEQTADMLAWNTRANIEAKTRRLELAAVAPDLFDLTYYSVDPKYYVDYYVKTLTANLFQGIVPIADLGSRAQGQGFRDVGIFKQIDLTSGFADAKDAYYLVKDWKHLLTGWVQGGAVDYAVNSPRMLEKFGDCQRAPGDSQPPVAGNCIAGGRVGYSVRLIHKTYLSSEHELGGPGAGQDKIRNQLPASF